MANALQGNGKGWQIVEAGPFHSAVVAEIHRACFPLGWSAEAVASLLNQPRILCLIAVTAEDSKPFGMIICRSVADEAEIISLGVLPSHRGQHIGEALIRRSIDDLQANNIKTAHLEVDAENKAAISLYESFGFTNTAIRKGYYNHPDGRRDAMVMRLELECLLK